MPTKAQFLNLDYYEPMLFNLVRIVVILVFAYVCTLGIGRLLRALRTYSIRIMMRAGGAAEYELEKRADTITSLGRKALVVMTWVIAGLMILKEMNFDVRPLLAGAGVVGVAIGFGAQNIVKDVLSGFFLMMENQIRINDVAVINGKGGLVEEINLRTTVLRGEDGAVHIFPNGSIQGLSNLTRQFSYYVFTLSMDYKADTDRVVDELRKVAAELENEESYRSLILAPLEIMGVDQLGTSGVVVKARFKTLPIQQWTVGREMNRRIKKHFDAAGIEMATSSQPVYLEVSPQLKEELKDAVREVLQERSTRQEVSKS